MPAAVHLSAKSARGLALGAQGFAEARPSVTPGRRQLLRVLDRLNVFQLDSVNVLVRSHYLPAFSRLGGYPARLLDRAAYEAPRQVFEYWGHAASLLPVRLQPFLRWRMESAAIQPWPMLRRVRRRRPGLIDEVLAEVRRAGPLSAGDLEPKRRRRTGPWWDWHDEKAALEWLFWTGQVTTSERRGFERLYDVPERVLPPEVLAAPTPAPEDARRALMGLAARALAVATERDLRDYFRFKPRQSRAAIGELVEAGELVPCRVEGWTEPAYVHRDAAEPARVDARALLSPFDSLIWERSRTHRLFGFHLRLEIYVPPPKRKFGYYVLPFLLGDSLVGRVDLKAHRESETLQVRAAHLERGQRASRVAGPLAACLHELARWLGLGKISVDGPGEGVPALRRALR